MSTVAAVLLSEQKQSWGLSCCLAVNSEGASTMVHWTKVLAAEPDDLSSVPGTHMEKGKNPLPKIVLNLPMYTVTYAHTCTH